MSDKDKTRRFLSLFIRFYDYTHIYRSRHREQGKAFLALHKLREFELKNGRPITVSEMARMSGLAIPNVCRLLKLFEEDGLIAQEKHGRTVSVHVTEKGIGLIAKQSEECEKEISSALDSLTEEEFANYIACGEKILAALHNNISEQNFSGEKDV